MFTGTLANSTLRGYSAYQIAVEEGFDGTIEEWLASLKGETGECASVTVNGTDPVITANSNTRYVCGELSSLDFTPCLSGICDVIFTCGNSLTALTLPKTVKLPEWFEIDVGHTYEISIVDGIYGTVMVW